MVVRLRAIVLLALTFILTLLVFAGCEDVPLDGATAVRDTLSEPKDPRGNDTVPTPVKVPSTITLTYLRRDASGPGGERRGTATFPVTSEVVLDTVFDGGRRVEVARINIKGTTPDSVRNAIVADRTNVPVRLGYFEINIPHIRVPAPGDRSRVPVDGQTDDDSRASAGITIAFPGSERLFLSTGRNSSRGAFGIDNIDRARKVISGDGEFVFKTRGGGDEQEIEFEIDYTLGY